MSLIKYLNDEKVKLNTDVYNVSLVVVANSMNSAFFRLTGLVAPSYYCTRSGVNTLGKPKIELFRKRFNLCH